MSTSNTTKSSDNNNFIWALILLIWFIGVFIMIKNCNGQNTIMGKVRYHINNHYVPAVMSLSTITNANYMVDTTYNGEFQFDNVPAGTYFIYAKEVLLPAGAYNATDAMMACQYSVGLIQLDILQRVTADVNNSGYINATDALSIVKHYAMGVPFNMTNGWFTEQQMISYPYTYYIIDVICIGDVNCSYY